MTEEFNTLEEYANTVKECLENSVHDFQMAGDSDILVMYATPPIAYAKINERFANGSNVGPLITFYQSGIEVKHEEQMGAFFMMPVRRQEGNYLLRAPVICQIKYTVTINALTELQADMICSQIMMATPFSRPYYTKLDGQWVLIFSDEYSNIGSVEAGDNKDKISSREMTLTIDRAYLQYNVEDLSAGTIYPDEYFENNSEES